MVTVRPTDHADQAQGDLRKPQRLHVQSREPVRLSMGGLGLWVMLGFRVWGLGFRV